MPKQASPEELEKLWRTVLLEGHGTLRFMRAMFKRVPSSPRCKQCNSPFRGIGGRVVGVMGFRPSRKNPNFCNACFEKLPPGGIELDIAVLFADVRGSTELGEKLGPSAYAGMMNRF